MKLIVWSIKAQVILHRILQRYKMSESDEIPLGMMRSSFISFNSDASNAMVTVGVRKRWVKCFLWQRRGSKCLAGGGEEKGRVMGVAGDRQAVLLFLPRHMSLLELPKQRTESQTAKAVLYPERTVCCLRECDLYSWTHIDAHGNDQQLKFYMWLMNYTERVCRKREAPGREGAQGWSIIKKNM